MMIEILSQTSQPSIPGIDPSWFSWPGVRTVVAVGIVIAAAMLVWKFLMPMLESTLKSWGLLRRTLKEQMQDELADVAKATDILNDANKMNPKTTDVPPSLSAKVKSIAGAVEPAQHRPIKRKRR